jgi:hypothetical protein
MLSQAGAVIEAGLALKTRQLKLAAKSYIEDRADQGQSAATSYAVAGGLFVGAAIFLIAACFVGVFALYRWIALTYGQFIAFGCIGGLMVILAVICAAVAMAQLHKRAKKIPSLSSRLIDAIKASPARLDPALSHRGASAVAGARNVMEHKVDSAAAPADRPARHANDGRAMLLVAATVLAWAVARNRRAAGKAKP